MIVIIRGKGGRIVTWGKQRISEQQCGLHE